jgi:hypothetical protein
MAIGDDFQIAANGDIRYTGSGTNYTVIALHRWLGDLMDDAAASGNDILDITDATASERSTDNIITLNSPYNIDDVAAQHLYDGSIIQAGGATIYDGIVVFAAAGAYLTVLQNGAVVTPNFWTTGLNADATNGISHRFMLKVRTGGADIDGRRLVGQTREFGFSYSEFKINGTSRGNNVMALTYATDLNNTTAAATVKGWTTITNTEGYRLLDVDNDTTTEPYYSEWNRATFTINQFYERAKWLSRRATSEASNAETGTNYTIGNGTITGQAQSFANGVVAQFLTRVHARLKKTGSPTGNLVAKLYAHSGTFGTSSVPTGGALATSVNIDVSKLTTTYAETEIGFATQFEMAASTNYVISFEYSGGDGSNNVQIEGDSTGTHAGNKSENTGSWAAQAAEDLWFNCFASPKLYGIVGEKFRGITHEITTDTPTGTFSAVEAVSWSGGTGQMLAINSTTAPTKMWIQLLTGVAPTDNQVITGGTSGATCQMNVTITERSLSFPFVGQSTGSAIIGAYGVGIETADLSASDKLFDLTNTQRTPPNNVTFTVAGLVASEDRVLVGPESGGTLQANQFTLNGALTGGAVTAVVINGAIPSDTPSSGTIRVKRNSGIYSRIAYSSYTGSTFTITSTDFSSDNANNGNDVFISYIDKLATSTSENFTVVYSSNRALFVRVRDGGGTPIKTFESAATLGSAGGSVTAIRTSDL